MQQDHVHFDTTAAGTGAHQASIEVGEGPSAAVYSGELPAPEAGAYVLVLDAGSLDFRADAAFPLQYTDPGTINVELNRMAEMLEKYEDDPSALVFVQSIGSMVRWDSYEGDEDLPKSWNRLAAAIGKLGGVRTIFNALEGANQSYAQVGPAGPAAAEWAKVASRAATRTPGQLAGTLARNDTAQLYPQNASPADEFGDELTLLAYRRPEPWPLHDTAAHLAAQHCVAEELQLPYPVEQNYANQNLADDWGNKQIDVHDLVYRELTGASCDTEEFGEEEFKAVVKQLEKEFADVPVVWQLVTNLKEPFLLQGTSSQLSLATIAENVREAVAPPLAPVHYHGLEISEEILLAAGALPFVGEGADALDLIAAGIGLVQATTLDSEGKPELPALSNADVDSFAAQLANEYKEAAEHFDQIGGMLVGDWGKLQTAYEQAVGPWYWNSQRNDRATNGLGFAARRFAYSTLFPTASGGLLRAVKAQSTYEVPTDPSRYPCWEYTGSGHHKTWYPFGKMATYGGVAPIVEAGGPATGGPRRENWVFARPTSPNEGNPDEGELIYDGYFSPSLPGGGVLNEMFGENTPEEPIPAFQPLEFAVANFDKLEVLDIWHSGGEDGNGETSNNVCEGSSHGFQWWYHAPVVP